MRQLLAIGVGGAVGSVLRYWLSTAVHTAVGRGFPYGTLAVNVIGCFAMGLLFVVFVERLTEATVWRAGLLTGVLGGFTTFSAFSIETFSLLEQGEPAKAATNAVLSVLLCIAATWLGVVLGRQLSS
ncbi:MAG TPA: fluoride efflux transporter CrcB [Burkholderiales bacterium]|nr:fluoride efflux transporter CrcB [Burkholderiales bacterium]